MNFWAMIVGLFFAAVSFFQRGPAPVAPVVPAPTPVNPKPAPDNHATLTQLILSETMNLGPMPITGGVIHRLTDSEASEIAALIIKNCAQYPNLPIALMAAWIRNESCFDALAQDPNLESLPKGASAKQKLENTDLGLAQFSWATLKGMPDFKGMTDEEIETQALDPEWSCGAFFEFCNDLRIEAKSAVLADPLLLSKIPNRDVTYLWIQAYNQGMTGATTTARKDGPSGNWKYAQSILDRYEKWKPLFVGP